MDKFNGFSQDEINRVEKKIVLQMKMGVADQPHTGIRRMPDKRTTENNCNNNNNNCNRPKQTTQSARLQTKIRKTTATTTGSSGSLNSAKSAPTPMITTTTAVVKTLPKSASTMPTDNHNSDGSVGENNTLDEVSVNRSMSKSIEEALFYQPLKFLTVNVRKNEEIAKEKLENDVETVRTDENEDTAKSSFDLSTSITPITSDSPFKGVSLKEFEVHRKLIEEQNKQKKQLLCKAIELHSKKTAAETRKIEEIKIELAKLDNELSVDVAILRKQIDAACINFTNIEKQYLKIEAQFLKAKMDLHQAAEKKELLTEHLCTVIAHNEDRKAEKLSELMLKVGLTPSGDPQTDDNSTT